MARGQAIDESDIRTAGSMCQSHAGKETGPEVFTDSRDHRTVDTDHIIIRQHAITVEVRDGMPRVATAEPVEFHVPARRHTDTILALCKGRYELQAPGPQQRCLQHALARSGQVDFPSLAQVHAGLCTANAQSPAVREDLIERKIHCRQQVTLDDCAGSARVVVDSKNALWIRAGCILVTQQAASADIDHESAIGMRSHLWPGRHRLLLSGSIERVAFDTAGSEIEFPEVTPEIAGIGRIRPAIPVRIDDGRRRQSACLLFRDHDPEW